MLRWLGEPGADRGGRASGARSPVRGFGPLQLDIFHPFREEYLEGSRGGSTPWVSARQRVLPPEQRLVPPPLGQDVLDFVGSESDRPGGERRPVGTEDRPGAPVGPEGPPDGPVVDL